MDHPVVVFCAVLLLSVTGSPAWAQEGALEGTVVTAETERPIPDASVVVRGGETRAGAATDAQGAFRIEGLAAGTYVVQVTAVGFQPDERRVELSAGATRTLSVALQAETYELNEIVVSGTEDRAVTSTTVQRVSAMQLERQDAADFSDVARLIPAAHVATNSRGQTLLYFRNAGDRQVAQFFDGALLNVPWDNRVDIGVLPAAMLEGVTVSKGVPSVRYGTNVIGGAVNFQSRSLSQPGTLTEITGALGTAEERRASVTHVGRQGALGYTGAFEYAHHGDYALPAGAEVPFSQRGRSTRTNTDRQFVNGFVRGSYRFESGVQVGASVLHVDAEKGVAPESHIDPAEERVRYWRYPTWRKSMLILSGDVPLPGDASLRGAAWGSRFSQDIYQYQSVDYEQLQETQADLDWTGGARLVWTQPAGVGAFTTAANVLTTRHQQQNVPFDSGQPVSDSTTVYRQHIFSLGTEYDVALSERLDLRVGASLDGAVSADIGPWAEIDSLNLSNGNATTALALTAGLTYRLTDALMWKAAVGRKPRFPTMRERFSGALGKFLPNPDLRPVTAFLGETGVVWRGAQFSGELTGFLTRTDDAIDQTTLPSGIEQRINLDGSRVFGVEVSGAAQPRDRLTMDGHFTWMHPRGERDGEWRKLEEKPAWLGTLTVSYELPLQFRVMGQTEYKAGTYARCAAVSVRCSADDVQQSVFIELPEALVFNLRLSRTFTFNDQVLAGRLFARVDNLTDELRVLQLGLPGAGREFEAGVKFTL